MVIFSQDNEVLRPITPGSTSRTFTDQAWSGGVTSLIRSMAFPGVKEVFLGSTPILPKAGPECLASHQDDVQACSASLRSSESSLDVAERSAAIVSNVQYINPTPWFCSATCTPIVGRYVVYLDRSHMTSTYASYLQVVLGKALGLN